MSAIVTGEAARSARSFHTGAQAFATPARDPRIEALEEENEALREALSAQRLALQEAVREARAEGEREGRAAAGDDSEKRLAALGAGVASATADWQARLLALDGLAAGLARAALAKLFDGAEGHSRFVREVIARQMRRLRREGLVAIRVSPGDFHDEAALFALAAEARTGSVAILADSGLESGECRIDLQLGHIDIGSRAQWARLADLLDALASEGAE
jgi:flagellar biosynthesis/type III secretory pathway protein FliH